MRLRFVLVTALLIGGCTHAPAKAPTLYDQLGGQPGVAAITENLLDAFAAEDEAIKTVLRSQDAREGSRAFVEKRTPRFTGT